MKKIKIVTDSTTDLPIEMLRELNIHVIPLTVTINGESYYDTIDLSPTEFLEKMQAAPELPKTSQPAVGEFVKLYDELGKDGSKVISIHLSRELSGTYATAVQASGLTDTEVEVIDSTFIAGALGFQVVEAAKMAMKQFSIQDIKARLIEIRDNSRLYVMIENLENLIKGGRIGKGSALIGSLLKIKPIATLKDGVYNPVAKVRSTTKVIKSLTEYFQADVVGKTIKGVTISHAGALELAQNLKDSISKVCGFENIQIEDTTAIISTHTGAGAIGFCYYAE